LRVADNSRFDSSHSERIADSSLAFECNPVRLGPTSPSRRDNGTLKRVPQSLWLDLPIIIAELGVPDSGRGSTARPQTFGHEARNRYAFAPWRASRVQWRSPHRQRPACCFQLREAHLSRDWSLSACRVRNQSRVAREPDAHKRDGTNVEEAS
jgi:hypothetical protein